jgi:hypothetical protein
LSSNPIIPGSGIGILLGLVMIITPWVTQFPESFLGKILMTMFGFFFILGTFFLFIASLSFVRK